MKTHTLTKILFAVGIIATASAVARDNDEEDFKSTRPLTIAVFGDWPDNQTCSTMPLYFATQ